MSGDVLEVPQLSAPSATATSAPKPSRTAAATAARKASAARKREARAKTAAPTTRLDDVIHAPTEQFDPEAQRRMHETLLLGIGAITLFLDVSVRPTADEVEMIIVPAERIVLRRVSLPKGVNPDIYDGLQIAIGVLSYGARISARNGGTLFAPRPARQPAPGNPQRAAQNPDGQVVGTNGPIQFPGASSQLASLHSSLTAATARGAGAGANGAAPNAVSGGTAGG